MKASYCAGSAAIEAAKAEGQGGLGLLTSRAEADKSMMQLKAEEAARESSKGKRKALDLEEGAGRKRSAVGEGDNVDARLNQDKLKDALSGKSNYAGKEVTEEDMGKLLLFSPREKSLT